MCFSTVGGSIDLAPGPQEVVEGVLIGAVDIDRGLSSFVSSRQEDFGQCVTQRRVRSEPDYNGKAGSAQVEHSGLSNGRACRVD